MRPLLTAFLLLIAGVKSTAQVGGSATDILNLWQQGWKIDFGSIRRIDPRHVLLLAAQPAAPAAGWALYSMDAAGRRTLLVDSLPALSDYRYLPGNGVDTIQALMARDPSGKTNGHFILTTYFKEHNKPSRAVAWRYIRLTNDYDNGCHFDKMGLLPCIDSLGTRYYVPPAVDMARQDIGVPARQLLMLRPVSSAGFAALVVAKNGDGSGPRYQWLYDYKRAALLNTADNEATYFITPSLIAVKTNGLWRLHPLDTLARTDTVQPDQAYRALFYAPARDTQVAKTFLAVNQNDNLIWVSIQQKQLQAFGKYEVAAWLSGNVPAFIARNDAGSWSLWRLDHKTTQFTEDALTDSAAELRQAGGDWFLCRESGTDTVYRLRQFGHPRYALDTLPLRAPGTLSTASVLLKDGGLLLRIAGQPDSIHYTRDTLRYSFREYKIGPVAKKLLYKDTASLYFLRGSLVFKRTAAAVGAWSVAGRRRENALEGFSLLSSLPMQILDYKVPLFWAVKPAEGELLIRENSDSAPVIINRVNASVTGNTSTRLNPSDKHERSQRH